MTAMTAELAADADISGQAGHRFACAAGRDSEQVSIPAATPDRRAVRSWQLLVLAAPAVVAVWSGWVGIGRMTGFGIVHPLAAIWDSLRIDSAVTLPVGVEAYAAYALRTWLTRSQQVSRRTRRFAGWSAAASLLLGMAGQVAYHVLAQAGATRAPGGSPRRCPTLSVLVLGMGCPGAPATRRRMRHRPGGFRPGTPSGQLSAQRRRPADRGRSCRPAARGRRPGCLSPRAAKGRAARLKRRPRQACGHDSRGAIRPGECRPGSGVARAQADCGEHRRQWLTDDLRRQPADRRLRPAHRRAVTAVSRPPGAAGAAPLVEPGIFARRSYPSGLLFLVVFIASMRGIMLIFNMLLQAGLGLTPWHSALTTAPWAQARSPARPSAG